MRLDRRDFFKISAAILAGWSAGRGAAALETVEVRNGMPYRRLGQTGEEVVAVGMTLAGHPPHRSRRAELPHRAPALGGDVKPLVGIRVYDSGFGHPLGCELLHPLPGYFLLFVAAPSERTPPQVEQVVSKGAERGIVSGYAIVAVVPLQYVV